jgi:hypothetical protein
MKSDKKTLEEYEKPLVVDYGELTELTAGHGTGFALDKDFPAKTPFHQLTFS